MPAPGDVVNVVDMDSLFKNTLAAQLARQSELLFGDHRALSGLLGGVLLAGNAQGINLSAGIPNPGASPLKAT